MNHKEFEGVSLCVQHWLSWATLKILIAIRNQFINLIHLTDFRKTISITRLVSKQLIPVIDALEDIFFE